MFVGRDTVYVKTYESLLKRKSQAFTELYFESYSSLPTRISKDGSLVFRFTIRNMEGESTAYPYIVYFVDQDGRKFALSSGSVTLPDSGEKIIEVKHTFLDSGQAGRIVVELTNLMQQIDFLIPRNS